MRWLYTRNNYVRSVLVCARIATHTSQASNPLEICRLQYLCMLNAWSEGCQVGVPGFLCQYFLEYIEDDFVSTVADAVDVLEAHA